MNRYKTNLLDLRCMDCMELLRDTPDKHYSLCIVDPPYAHNSGNAFKSRLKRYGDLSFNDNKPTAAYWDELKRVSVNQIVWGGNYFLDWLGNTKCMIFWHKHQPVKTYATGEIAWTSFQDKHVEICDLPYYGFTGREPDRAHPNQKPVALYKWLLHNYAKPGDRILDTHLGSMSISIACHYAGYHLTGCELDEDYFKAGVERVKRETAQRDMFTEGLI
jgi:site-specific DNA-methyltransferase (adenine-specific)